MYCSLIVAGGILPAGAARPIKFDSPLTNWGACHATDRAGGASTARRHAIQLDWLCEIHSLVVEVGSRISQRPLSRSTASIPMPARIALMSRRAQLEQLLAAEPRDPFLRYGLAMTCVSDGDTDAA